MSYNKQNTHPGFLKTRDETEVWLDSVGIKNYTINSDLTVDVDGGVWIQAKNLDSILVQFGRINGFFNCSKNNLTSLKGCPIKIGGSFFCHNNNLTSLEHCPKEVVGSFNCSNNNLTSLEYCPTKVDGNLDCSNNNLTSLKGCPKEVVGNFYCQNNMIVTEIPEEYDGQDNPSWETSDPELILSRFFDKLEGLDGDTKVDVLATLKKLEPEFYNSEAFQVYNPDSMLSLMKRSREVTGGLFEL